MTGHNGSQPALTPLVSVTVSAADAPAAAAGPELERLMRIVMSGFRLMYTVGSTEAMEAALEVERLLARIDSERRAAVVVADAAAE